MHFISIQEARPFFLSGSSSLFILAFLHSGHNRRLINVCKIDMFISIQPSTISFDSTAGTSTTFFEETVPRYSSCETTTLGRLLLEVCSSSFTFLT